MIKSVSIIGPDSVTETYRYDGDGNRITRTRQGQTTVYFQGLWEDTLGVNARKLYTFGGQVVAIRDGTSVTYPHGDQLGSVSVMCSERSYDSPPADSSPDAAGVSPWSIRHHTVAAPQGEHWGAGATPRRGFQRGWLLWRGPRRASP